MKTFAEKYHSKESLMNNDIQYTGAMVWTPTSNIKIEMRNDFENLENEMQLIYYYDLEYYCIDSTEYEWCIGSSFDELMFEDFVDSIIKDYEHYLICAYHSNWLGQTGCKIEDNKYNIFQRGYDVSQYIVGASVKGKALLVNEFSHDVPMGHRTLIIGLTEKEYGKLMDIELDWEKAVEFSDKISETIIKF